METKETQRSKGTLIGASMTDRYMKTVLTIIAASLFALAAENVVKPASAGSEEPCGSSYDPCYVKTDYASPLYVTTPPSQPIEVFEGR